MCELYAVVLGQVIGRGPDAWLFDASFGVDAVEPPIPIVRSRICAVVPRAAPG